MTKLTDTQLVVLNAAAGRGDRTVLPLPKSLKINKGTATSVLKALLAKGLVEERPAKAGTEFWRQDDDGHGFMLIISDNGIAALDGGPDAAPKAPAVKDVAGKKSSPKARRETVSKGATTGSHGASGKRPGGKVETILTLLRRPDGARLTELEKATGWQPHSVRAALTGLRKRGIEVTRERKDDVTTYSAKVA